MNPNADFTELMLRCNALKAAVAAHRALQTTMEAEAYAVELARLEAALAEVEQMIWRDYWLA